MYNAWGGKGTTIIENNIEQDKITSNSTVPFIACFREWECLVIDLNNK